MLQISNLDESKIQKNLQYLQCVHIIFVRIYNILQSYFFQIKDVVEKCHR